jgi:hypothetical protein
MMMMMIIIIITTTTTVDIHSIYILANETWSSVNFLSFVADDADAVYAWKLALSCFHCCNSPH